MYSLVLIIALCLGSLAQSTITFSIPAAAPTNSMALDPAPIGISFEFFAYPEYFTSVQSTNQCLQNLEALTGTWPPIRIGGTTQDRATYDPASPSYVNYTVSSPIEAPAKLTFGPSFMTLASTYQGQVVLGLNRAGDNQTNTIDAGLLAAKTMTNLLAIELGNEPDFWSQPGSKIVGDSGGKWDPQIDAASQDLWDIVLGTALGKFNIIQAGVFFSSPYTWGIAGLTATKNPTALTYVNTYSHHFYPGGNVQSLMSHSNIINSLSQFVADISSATAVGKPYVLGETNSVADGGGEGICNTFGAAIWVMDYVLHATTLNITRAYFHHGTIGACYYCWWGQSTVDSPYYGAYAATAAMAHGSYIYPLDTLNTNYGGYAIYSSQKKPQSIVLVNTDYYDGTGTRGNQSFVLNGIPGNVTSVRAKRLTAATALSSQDQGSTPSFGGQYFQNATCNIAGAEVWETTSISSGIATFTLAATEALVIFLS